MPMAPDLGPSARAFRDEVRAWLESNRPEGLVGVEAEQLALRRVPGADDWARKLHEAGFMCVSWPKEYGGRGLGGVEVAVLNEEFARKLAKRNETLRASIERDLGKGRPVRRAYLVAERGTKGRWFVQRGELAAFVTRRRMPAVRVGYDLTLTTEKSLGVLALLSGPATRDGVLDAIRSGNDWAPGPWAGSNATPPQPARTTR
ncbi:MAG TPA: acyl-CoA dehydrogenase family protein [Acidimicrobiales bacterium]|nr:acyl-CoA dehydrogenase family protein [Acidimicrobiales bacterium]